MTFDHVGALIRRTLTAGNAPQKHYPRPADVPPLPDTEPWEDELRWYVFVMNQGDPQRAFAASCLQYAIKFGDLTEMQAAACLKMSLRIRDHWAASAIDCQSDHRP